MRRLYLGSVLILALLLTACGAGRPAAPTQALRLATAALPAGPAEAAPAASQPAAQAALELPSRSDSQGAVQVVVTPLPLRQTDQQLRFSVRLETHSVSLSMDLAALTSLSNDGGVTVQALSWDAPRGGHHVSGVLAFPVRTTDGTGLLDGASTLTLVMNGVDAPQRTFTWDLGQTVFQESEVGS